MTIPSGFDRCIQYIEYVGSCWCNIRHVQSLVSGSNRGTLCSKPLDLLERDVGCWKIYPLPIQWQLFSEGNHFSFGLAVSALDCRSSAVSLPHLDPIQDVYFQTKDMRPEDQQQLLQPVWGPDFGFWGPKMGLWNMLKKPSGSGKTLRCVGSRFYVANK
jgi:hypothetical protein